MGIGASSIAIGTFPFGQPVKELHQLDRRPKKVFVLGVYASAVHALWLDAAKKPVVKALAVASEPCIFWDGNQAEAEAIIRQVRVPQELGKLQPVAEDFNGPSGRALDTLFLKPLGFTRADAWLCDLVPHSCCNDGQKDAIERAYRPIAERHGLPNASVPAVPRTLADDARRSEILTELRESQATLLVLLGDQPIRWFLRHYDSRWSKLSDFLNDGPYGHRHRVMLDGLAVDAMPLCHPRQAARLGRSSEEWAQRHEAWITRGVV